MASIDFELADSIATRKDLHALGAEFTAKSGKLHVKLPDVIESEALFLAVKAIVSHGAVSRAPEGERVLPEHTEEFTAKKAKEEEETKAHPATAEKAAPLPGPKGFEAASDKEVSKAYEAESHTVKTAPRAPLKKEAK